MGIVKSLQRLAKPIAIIAAVTASVR